MKCNVSQIYDRLYKKALGSPCKYRIAAIGLDFRGNVISIATNIPGTTRNGSDIHAEQRIMKNSPRSLKRIIIIRIGGRGEVRPIDPCNICIAKASELGVTIESIPTVAKSG